MRCCKQKESSCQMVAAFALLLIRGLNNGDTFSHSGYNSNLCTIFPSPLHEEGIKG